MRISCDYSDLGTNDLTTTLMYFYKETIENSLLNYICRREGARAEIFYPKAATGRRGEGPLISTKGEEFLVVEEEEEEDDDEQHAIETGWMKWSTCTYLTIFMHKVTQPTHLIIDKETSKNTLTHKYSTEGLRTYG